MQTIHQPFSGNDAHQVTEGPEKPSRPRRRRILLGAGAAAIALAGTGVAVSATSGSGSAHTLAISATEYKFTAPSSIRAGLTKFTLHDHGVLPHQAELLKLNPGVPAATVEDALMKSANGYAGLSQPVGGPGGILSGRQEVAWVNLQPGTYIIACFLRGGTGVGPNHAMLGMMKPLTVTGSTPAAEKPPASQGTVALTDHKISLPKGFGHGVYHVVNQGSQVHELDILALAPGKTASDFVKYMIQAETGKLPKGPAAAPPFANGGGFSALSVGDQGWTSLNLPAGNYVATSFIPNVHTGIPDVASGLLTPFSVGS